MQTLRLFSRKACHLCEVMENDLRQLDGELGFAWEKIDVDADIRLCSRYGAHVPVLEDAAGREICRHRLDEAALRAALR